MTDKERQEKWPAPEKWKWLYDGELSSDELDIGFWSDDLEISLEVEYDGCYCCGGGTKYINISLDAVKTLLAANGYEIRKLDDHQS